MSTAEPNVDRSAQPVGHRAVRWTNCTGRADRLDRRFLLLLWCNCLVDKELRELCRFCHAEGCEGVLPGDNKTVPSADSKVRLGCMMGDVDVVAYQPLVSRSTPSGMPMCLTTTS